MSLGHFAAGSSVQAGLLYSALRWSENAPGSVRFDTNPASEAQSRSHS